MISQSVAKKLIERHNNWNTSLGKSLTEQSNSEPQLTERDLLPQPIDVPTEAQGSDLLRTAVAELTLPNMTNSDLRNLLTETETLSDENQRRIARLIVHAVQRSLFAFAQPYCMKFLYRDCIYLLPSLVEIEKSEVPNADEFLQSQRSLALLAIYGRESVREIAGEALGELFDPRLIPGNRCRLTLTM